MAEVKDKTVTVDALNEFHKYNKTMYAENSANGLRNLLSDGMTILSAYQYGDELPPAGNVGRIFFKKSV